MADAVTVSDLYTRPSPSALQLVDMCEARAAGKYVARLPDSGDSQKAQLGSRCHAITADYASKGTVPPNHETFEIVKNGTPRTYYPGRIVRNILHRLPFAAGTVPNVEHKLTLKWRGIEFNGSIDWETAKLQGDHKFTTDLSYGFDANGRNKDGKDLRLDAQRIIYGADWFMRHDDDDDELTQQWTYGQFDCKASRAVTLVATRAEIFKLLDDVIMPNAEKLLGWVQKQVDWNTLPKNTNACSKFPPTGCPYSSKCTRTQRERIHGLMASDFIARLKAKDAAKAGGTVPPAVAAPVTVIVNDAPSTDVETDVEDAVAAIAGTVSPINPPGEAADLPESATVAEKTAASAEPKKRGRPRKDATPAAAAAQSEQDAVTAQSKDAGATWTVVKDIKTEDLKGFYLLIDCLPVRGALGNDMIHAADLIAQAHEHVRKECEVLDFRLVEYGKGAGMLAATMEVIVSELPDGSVVYLDTKSAEGSVVLQTLMSKASAVIRAA